MAPSAIDAAVATIFREEAAGLTARMTRLLGDFAVAEEIVGDTLVVAIQRWRRDGLPRRPGAWLQTTARHLAIDRIRREHAYDRKLLELRLVRPTRVEEADDRLRLIFTCCHPALAPEARIALTLQAILGFTAPEIASAFLVNEAAVAQRLSRARRKIRTARIPYAIPPNDELVERLEGVLVALYLTFNEGYLSSRSTVAFRRDLAEDAAWLTALLAEALPQEPEPLGLLALMRLQLSRSRARFDAGGMIVLLRDQDRTRWDRRSIGTALELLDRAASLHRPGRFQLEAAIAACHAEASTWADTDWVQILLLYDALLERWPSPIVRLNRAIALREVVGPEAALAEVEAVAGELDRYHLLHATRAELLRSVGALESARDAELRALALTQNPAERALLQRRTN